MFAFFLVLVIVVIVAIAVAANSPKKVADLERFEVGAKKDQKGLKQTAVLHIEMEISRTTWTGRYWWRWVATCEGQPFMASKEWEDNSRKRNLGEALMGYYAPGYESVGGHTKRDGEFRAKSAPYFWELVHELEKEGWKLVYGTSGVPESMIKAEMQIVNGAVVPMDPNFTLKAA